MTQEKSFYVGISNRSEIRRNLLECSKDIVGILKEYDHLSEIREEKIEKIVELKKVLGEIKQLNILLRETLPDENIKPASQNKIKYTRNKPSKKAVLMPSRNKSVKPSSEIKKLEDELSEIEARLNKMGV